MPRWHFLDFSVLCSVGLFFFFFVLRMRAFSLALKHQHHQQTRIETRRRDSTSLRPGRRTATMMMRKLDTKTREREREKRGEIGDFPSALSFGRLFVLWSTFCVFTFFWFFQARQTGGGNEAFCVFARFALFHSFA